ncbi:MAG: aminoacyl-tRNA hydrolase [Parachlamydiales bacterium]
MIRLIVGLGNPGKEYERTRHNLGFLVTGRLAEEWGIPMKRDRKFLGWIGRGRVGEADLLLLMPSTYMNESGRAVQKVCAYYGIGPAEVVVIADDAALPFGELRLRPGGSSGGHNGLKSIEQALGSQGYVRLRIGVGHRGELASHVLGPFNKEEGEALPALLDRGAAILARLAAEPLELVMNEVNRKE